MTANRNDVVYGLTAGGAKVALKVDADGVLQSSATLSGDITAGTEYTEGATDATITGGVVMWEDGSDTIRAVSAAKPLPVSIISSAVGGDATAAKQDTGNATLAAIDGHVDGLEASAASIDTKTPALGQAVAGSSVPVVLPAAQITTLTPPAAITGFATSAKQDTGNTSIASIDTKTPALGQAVAGSSVPVVLPSAQITTLTPPAAITGFATETTLAAQSAKLPAALGQTTMAGSLSVAVASNQSTLPVTPAAGELHLGEVGGNMIAVSVEFTRPNDTTPYTAGDVVSDSTGATTMQAIAAAARVSGGSGEIMGIRIATDKKSITPRIRIHFFNTTGATLAVDNLAYKEVYADTAKRVFSHDMPAMSTATDTTNSDMSRSIDKDVCIPYVCATTLLYFVLEALDAFTPAALEKFTVTVYLRRN